MLPSTRRTSDAHRMWCSQRRRSRPTRRYELGCVTSRHAACGPCVYGSRSQTDRLTKRFVDLLSEGGGDVTWRHHRPHAERRGDLPRRMTPALPACSPWTGAPLTASPASCRAACKQHAVLNSGLCLFEGWGATLAGSRCSLPSAGRIDERDLRYCLQGGWMRDSPRARPMSSGMLARMLATAYRCIVDVRPVG